MTTNHYVRTMAPGHLESLRLHMLPLRMGKLAEVRAKSAVPGEAERVLKEIRELLTGPPARMGASQDYGTHVRELTAYLEGRGRMVGAKELPLLMKVLDEEA